MSFGEVVFYVAMAFLSGILLYFILFYEVK